MILIGHWWCKKAPQSSYLMLIGSELTYSTDDLCHLNVLGHSFLAYFPARSWGTAFAQYWTARSEKMLSNGTGQRYIIKQGMTPLSKIIYPNPAREVKFSCRYLSNISDDIYVIKTFRGERVNLNTKRNIFKNLDCGVLYFLI